MRGIKNLKEIEIQLKIIKNIQDHELINALQTQFNDNQTFSLIIYQTLSDMWLNLERASELKKYIQKYCELVEPVGINDKNFSIDENSYFFKIKCDGKFYILKAVQKSQSDVIDSQEIQYNFLNKQIKKQNNNSDLYTSILKIIDDHPLYKILIQNRDYSFIIFEYFVCNISDLLIYQNDIQTKNKQQIQRRIPLIIIARIMVEIFKIIKNIKNEGVKIKFFNLNNIYLIQHNSVAQKSVIKVKIGNLTCTNQEFNLNQQAKIIYSALNHSLNEDQQSLLKNYNLIQQKDSQNRNSNNVYCIDQFDSDLKLNDDYELIVSQNKLAPSSKTQVLEQGIIHQIVAQSFNQDEKSIDSWCYDNSNQESNFEESNFEESKISSQDSNQFDLINDTQSMNTNTNYFSDSTNKFIQTNEENFKFSNILKQLFIEANKNLNESFNFNSSLQKAYELSNEFKDIKSIIEQNNYINFKFVKLGQNSKHFVCQSSYQESDYYVKVYNKNTQHILTDNFINNQIKARNNINWNNESIIFLSQFEQTQIQEKYLSNSQNSSPGLSEAQKYILNPNQEISQDNFRIFFYEKCLCNLRDILPYLQPGQLIFPKNQNTKTQFTIYDLLKHISMQIVQIFKCIHDSNFVHMDFDLTKFLIDKKGNIRISNFHLCQQPTEIKAAFFNSYNQIYQKILQRLLDINESFIDREINGGKYNHRFIFADFFMLGFTLTELFLCLDYRKFSEKILSIQLSDKRRIWDFSEIQEIKLLNPKILYYFDQNYQIVDQHLQQQQIFQISEQQKKLTEIALDLMCESKDKNTNNLLAQTLKLLENS
ncbi:hypothetical protein ABPG72_016038 [Tetrahymena utriculariae]